MSDVRIVRAGRIGTASGVVIADIGMVDGRIAATRADPGKAGGIADGSGPSAMPGGEDSHVHLSQPSLPGARDMPRTVM